MGSMVFEVYSIDLSGLNTQPAFLHCYDLVILTRPREKSKEKEAALVSLEPMHCFQEIVHNSYCAWLVMDCVSTIYYGYASSSGALVHTLSYM